MKFIYFFLQFLEIKRGGGGTTSNKNNLIMIQIIIDWNVVQCSELHNVLMCTTVQKFGVSTTFIWQGHMTI